MDPNRSTRSRAARLALQHYAAQVRTDRGVAIPALILPAIGDILVHYVPPLIVARVLLAVGKGQHPTLGDMAPYLIWFGAAWLAGEAFWRLGIYFLNRLVSSGLRRLYTDAMSFLLQRDLAFFHDNFAGALTKRALGYARAYDVLLSTMAYDVVSALIPLVFVSVVLWGYSPWLMVGLIVLVTLTILAIVPLIRRRRALVDVREATSTALAGHISDSITNMEAVRAFAREDHEARIHRANVDAHVSAALHTWDYQNNRVNIVLSPMYVLTNVIGLMLALTARGTGAFSTEAVFITFSYYASFTRIMWGFNNIYRNIESYLAEAAQFTELLLEPPRVNDDEDAVDAALPAASVSFDQVRFRYHDRDGEHLFDGLNLHIASGESVGLVGHSGGGKTTVTRLLLRFMDIDDGEIRLGDMNIAGMKQATLRSMIAYVPQDPMMFHRTLADNIRFGRLNASDAEIREAAERAHATDFIDALPDGFETLVGERGVKLSGGQRQRIAIARAILKDAPILVLDEATSALDSESEGAIQDALWTLMQGRTAIVIAHRLSTVQRMDRLIVLEEGRLVESGSHAELLAQGGIYATLWTHQSGGFLDDDARAPSHLS